VRVSASNPQPGARPGSFRIAGLPATPEETKPTQEAVMQVRRGLVSKGYRESPDANGAQLEVTVSCGAGTPSIQRTTTREPIYRVVQAPSHYERMQVGNTATGAPMFELRLVESPAIQQLAGYREIPHETKIFKKYLRLTAHEIRAGTGPTGQVNAWSVEGVCEEAGESVSEIVPVLAAACLVYVGRETATAELIRMSDADRDVASLRRSN
jgi:hypothetical protein